MAKNPDRTAYDLSGGLDLEGLADVRPGTSLLVSGPAMTGKDRIVTEVLADGLRDGEGVIAVTTDRGAADVYESLAAGAPDADGFRIVVVDCRADGSRTDEEHDSGAAFHHVGSPADLTSIGIGITNGFERLEGAGVARGRLALTSLSTMLNYTDKQTVFKFCHVLSSRLDSAGFPGLFTIDSAAHDDRTLQVVKQAFDGLVEIRERDGVREARVRGLSGSTSAWTEL